MSTDPLWIKISVSDRLVWERFHTELSANAMGECGKRILQLELQLDFSKRPPDYSLERKQLSIVCDAFLRIKGLMLWLTPEMLSIH